MSPLQWIQTFAAFVPVAEAVVDAFVEAHPELQDPPPEPAKAAIEADFQRKLDKRFPRESDR